MAEILNINFTIGDTQGLDLVKIKKQFNTRVRNINKQFPEVFTSISLDILEDDNLFIEFSFLSTKDNEVYVDDMVYICMDYLVYDTLTTIKFNKLDFNKYIKSQDVADVIDVVDIAKGLDITSVIMNKDGQVRIIKK